MSVNDSALKRLDKLISEKYPTLSNRHIEEALDNGLICGPEGRKIKKGQKLESLSGLVTEKLDEQLLKIKKGNANLKVIVIQDEADFCVIHKPPGMPSHPLSLFDENTVTQWAFAQFKDLSERFEPTQPTVTPHRLDTDTEGVLIVSKTPENFQRWRDEFIQKNVTKTYLAWVQGEFTDAKTIDLPIAHDSKRKSRMVVVHDDGENPSVGLPAHSDARPLKYLPSRNISLVEVVCKTGVTHQVRVHLASLGHPLVGDSLYDVSLDTRQAQSPHHLLLASKLTTSQYSFSADPKGFQALFLL